MVRVIVVVRELGRIKPEYSLPFDLPEVPKVGAYISIFRPDVKSPHSEDLIVRQVWWHLNHPETEGMSDDQQVGSVTDIMVECDQAIGPYALDSLRDMLKAARERGINVEDFDVERFSIRQDELVAIGRDNT